MPVQRTPVLAALKISEGATPAQAIAAIIRWIAQAVIALTPVFTFGTTRIQGFDVPSPVKANDGQAFAWNASTQRFDYVPVGSGAVTNVTGTAPIASSGGSTPDISLDDSPVAPGTYGNALNVAQFTVDQKGLLQFAANVPIVFPSVGTAWSMADLPASPDPRDDEFLTAGLSGWTSRGTHSGTAIDPYASFATAATWRGNADTNRLSWFMVQPSTDGTIQGITKAVTWGTNDCVYVRFSADNRSTYGPSNARVELRITDGVSFTHNVGIAWNLDPSAPAVSYFTDGTTTQNYALASNVGTLGVQGLLIQKAGTSYFFWALDMNGSRVPLGTVTNTNAMTHVLLGVVNNTSTGPGGFTGNAIMGFDFVRFVASANFLP